MNFCLFLQTHLQSQRALLIQGTESLNNASKSIERSQRIAAETDQIGTDIIEELGGQREQLDHTRDRVRERYLDQRPLLSLLNKQIINCTSKMSTINSPFLFLCSYPPQCLKQCLFSYSIISWFTLARTWAAAGKSCAQCPDGNTYTITKHFTSLELFPNLWEYTVSNIPLSCHYRLVTNKLLLSVIIIMELAILAGVVYLKFFRKRQWDAQDCIRLHFPFSYFWWSRVSGPMTVCWMLLWLWMSHGSEWVVILSAKLY